MMIIDVNKAHYKLLTLPANPDTCIYSWHFSSVTFLSSILVGAEKILKLLRFPIVDMFVIFQFK
jgi:hypothetical protein